MTNQNKLVFLLSATILILLSIVLIQDEPSLPNLENFSAQTNKTPKQRATIDIEQINNTPKKQISTQKTHDNAPTLKPQPNEPKFLQAKTDSFKIQIKTKKNIQENNTTTIKASVNNQAFTIKIPKNQKTITIYIANQITNEQKNINIEAQALHSQNININFDTLAIENTKKEQKNNSILPL